MLEGEVLEQPCTPSIPFVQVVSALAHGNDPGSPDDRGQEVEVVVVIILPRDGQWDRVLSRPLYERIRARICAARCVFDTHGATPSINHCSIHNIEGSAS